MRISADQSWRAGVDRLQQLGGRALHAGSSSMPSSMVMAPG